MPGKYDLKHDIIIILKRDKLKVVRPFNRSKNSGKNIHKDIK